MKIEIRDGKKLDFFKELYQEALTKSNELQEQRKKWMSQFKGSKENDEGVDAKYVRNITFELIDSQVTTYIPTPKVTSKMWSEKNERNAKSIETLLRNKRNELPFEELNDLDERLTPVYGGSVFLIEWDESIKTHNTVGDVKVTNITPDEFIGQPNIYNIDDMDYCFVKFETTKEDIVRKFGVSVSVVEETESDEYDDNDKTATLIVCYYKDEDGNICRYVFSGDTEIADDGNYYARKRYYCTVCGKKKGICQCENPHYELMSQDEEELTKDITLSNGDKLYAKSISIVNGAIETEEIQRETVDQNGRVVLDPVTLLPQMTTMQIPKMTQTKIPYYKINVFPIVIRKNISQEKNLFGQSDCEVIREQQQASNKIGTRMLEKLFGSGVMPYLPDGSNFDLENSIFGKVLKIKPSQKGLLGTLDTSVSIQQDVQAMEMIYEQAKRLLGITNSFQGNADSSAQSGVAKQVQVQQSEGRLASKRQMKNAAYADMDKIIFSYYLAYADETRPYTYKDGMGRVQNVMFNRYDFVERDEQGKYYYNDQFLFETSAAIDLNNNRETIWAENRANWQTGAYGDPTQSETQLIFWQNMEMAHYPFAHEMVERIKERIEKEQQAIVQQIKQTGQPINYETMMMGGGNGKNVL